MELPIAPLLHLLLLTNLLPLNITMLALLLRRLMLLILVIICRYDHDVVGTQSHSIAFNWLTFKNDIALARTYGFESEVRYYNNKD